MMLMTPASASEPYSVERGPLTISMRSIMSGARFCSAAPPAVAGLTRTPSISTSVWFDSPPRMNADVSWPGPPLRPMSMPAWKRSSSAMSPACAARICVRSMTMVAAPIRDCGCGVRLAVTSTGSSATGASPLAEGGSEGEGFCWARLYKGAATSAANNADFIGFSRGLRPRKHTDRNTRTRLRADPFEAGLRTHGRRRVLHLPSTPSRIGTRFSGGGRSTPIHRCGGSAGVVDPVYRSDAPASRLTLKPCRAGFRAPANPDIVAHHTISLFRGGQNLVSRKERGRPQRTATAKLRR